MTPEEPVTGGDLEATTGTRPALAAFGHVLRGRYELGRVIGRGGMGVVLEAHDRVLDRPVVAKILPRELIGDSRAAARLLREGRVAARVSHPAIVAVLDLGVLETGEPYLVMEHLAGHDLGQCMDVWGVLSLEDTLALLMPVAEALDCLHGAGVVHRDVKPSNVFVLDGQPTRVKLIDFGLALLDDTTFTRLTQQGVLVGTVEYLAPELVRGGRPTPSADVYALACVAYEMLSGRLPFEGNPLDILLDKGRLAPPRLDVLGVAGERVATVMERGLSTRPLDRPARATDLLRELAQAAAEPPAPAIEILAPSVVAAPPHWEEAPIVIPRDTRMLRAALSFLVLVVVLVAALVISTR